MEWMILPLKRYADFSGRSRRKEYWMFFLLQMIINLVLLTAFVALLWMTFDDWTLNGSPSDGDDGAFLGMIAVFAVWAIFWLAFLIPNVAVIVRRFHDQGISGTVGVLLYIATVVLTFPGIVILIFMGLEGKNGENEYGPDPKFDENAGDVFR